MKRLKKRITVAQMAYRCFVLLALTVVSCAAPNTVPKAKPIVVCDCGPPDKSYFVFFDLKAANLKPKSMQIIEMVASDRIALRGTTVKVVGYTDGTGIVGENLTLSTLRAKTVAAQLIADGVPSSSISTLAYGEGHQLVPTPDGVSDLRNRRVEIILAYPMYGP